MYFLTVKACGLMFQSPKGRLQTIKLDEANIPRTNVSIPKGKATNRLKSLILLYQLYSAMSMFFYRYICRKTEKTQQCQSRESSYSLLSTSRLPAKQIKLGKILTKPNTNQTRKFLHVRSTETTFGQNAYLYLNCPIKMHVYKLHGCTVWMHKKSKKEKYYIKNEV